MDPISGRLLLLLLLLLLLAGFGAEGRQTNKDHVRTTDALEMHFQKIAQWQQRIPNPANDRSHSPSPTHT